jgi:NAD(P)-dependent dehydrogenase (short-subunit alcohol dehydrogenase family)
MAISYALVTGANQGLGLAIARGLGKVGFTPILGCRNLEKAKEAAESLAKENIQAEIVQLDVTSDSSILSAREHIEKLCAMKNGSFDLLVNNAGIAGDSSKSTRENFTMVLDTNVASIAVIMDTFIPLLQKSKHELGGQIINVSSTRGSLLLNSQDRLPPSRSIPYSVSKAALNLLTVDYARKYKGEVRINAICPGHCATNLNGFTGKKDVNEGAKVVLQVAVDPDVGTGGYFQLEGTEKYTSAPW